MNSQITNNQIINMTPRQRRRRFDKIKYILNTAMCQFTANASKTKKAIEYIKHFSILSRVISGEIENGVHHITIVLTNNNLLETTMWKHRLSVKTKGLNICTLSSMKDSTYHSIDQVITSLSKAKTANDLPDILVMCTHGVRITNIIDLLDTLESGNLDFTEKGIHQITTTIMFDEADKNKDVIAEFINEMQTKVYSKTDNTVVRDIHFITATPGQKFWKKLADVGVKKLNNINHYLREDDVLDIKHEELYKDYRKISDHNVNYSIKNMTKNPIEYVELVLTHILRMRAEGKRTEPLNIFAPSEVYVATHRNMAEIFRKNKFTTLILNGEQKGFLSPDNTFESLDDFNMRTKTKGELYDTLVAWRKLDENRFKDLAITGYLNLERGVTFCTLGFSFTDMIVSAYHMTNLMALIQILGRANGDKKYVEIFNIWAPEQVIGEANNWINMMNELHTRDPEEFKESDFRKKTKKEIMEKALTIPIVINVDEEDWDNLIKKKGLSYDEESFLEYIGKKNNSLYKNLKENKITKKQISMPEKPDSYKKHITDLITAAEGSRKFGIDITKKELDKDLYQIFLDSKQKRLIISIHYGSRIKPKEDESKTIITNIDQ